MTILKVGDRVEIMIEELVMIGNKAQFATNRKEVGSIIASKKNSITVKTNKGEQFIYHIKGEQP